MASYTLSPVWGAGAQLFDNSGNVLTGGKIYTYAAGTTTPAVTYTDPIGNTFNSNPIIADASGRLSNEIWLPVAAAYKFVLKDTNDVLIATYDNIPTIPQPPIANDASSISYEQGYTVTAGAFTVGATYLITSVGTTNFVAIGAAANVTGILFTATGVGSGTGTAQYSRTVQSKLRETISVKDFGAVGDGVADDTVAIQAAANYAGSLNGGADVIFPPGRYIVTTTLTIPSLIRFIGNSKLQGGSAKLVSATATHIFALTKLGASRNAFFDLLDMHIEGARNKTQELISLQTTPSFVSWSFSTIQGCYFVNIPRFSILATGLHFINNNFQNIWNMTMRGADCSFTFNYIGLDDFYGDTLTTDILVEMIACTAFAWTDNYISSFPVAPATICSIPFVISGSNDTSLVGNRIDGGTSRTFAITAGSYRVTAIANRIASLTTTAPVLFSNVTQITFNNNEISGLTASQNFAAAESLLQDIVIHNNQTNSRSDTTQHDLISSNKPNGKISLIHPNLTYKNTTTNLDVGSEFYGRVITNTGGSTVEFIYFYSANMVPTNMFYFRNTGTRLIIIDSTTSTTVYDSSTSGYTTGKVFCYVAGTATVSAV
jgi:hypothetical protein